MCECVPGTVALYACDDGRESSCACGFECYASNPFAVTDYDAGCRLIGAGSSVVVATPNVTTTEEEEEKEEVEEVEVVEKIIPAYSHGIQGKCAGRQNKRKATSFHICSPCDKAVTFYVAADTAPEVRIAMGSDPTCEDGVWSTGGFATCDVYYVEALVYNDANRVDLNHTVFMKIKKAKAAEDLVCDASSSSTEVVEEGEEEEQEESVIDKDGSSESDSGSDSLTLRHLLARKKQATLIQQSFETQAQIEAEIKLEHKLQQEILKVMDSPAYKPSKPAAAEVEYNLDIPLCTCSDDGSYYTCDDGTEGHCGCHEFCQATKPFYVSIHYPTICSDEEAASIQEDQELAIHAVEEEQNFGILISCLVIGLIFTAVCCLVAGGKNKNNDGDDVEEA